MRVALVASSRFPIAEPFAGGLEAATWLLARELRARGHDVTLIAGPGSDERVGRVQVLDVAPYVPSPAAQSDVSMPPAEFMSAHHAYQRLMLELAEGGSNRFDVVHNNSLHYLPVAMAGLLDVPVVTTLHTPPTPWLESAIDARCPVTFAAVSGATARSWRHRIPRADVVHNGVDLESWTPDPRRARSGYAVWTGRLVPEKGPHLALEAARRAGMPLLLAGPASDRDYLETEVLPRLGPDARWVGHLRQHELRSLVAGADVALVTPCWDEPYGLVVAEALACGTPVAAIDRGAVGEVTHPSCARLAPPDDVEALAEALRQAAGLDRAAARRHAEDHCSSDRMVERYEQLYAEAA